MSDNKMPVRKFLTVAEISVIYTWIYQRQVIVFSSIKPSALLSPLDIH